MTTLTHDRTSDDPVARAHANAAHVSRASRRHVLHLGCGHRAPEKLHTVFRSAGWKEVRLDLNQRVDPDIVCSLHDMRGAVASEEYDAVWSSHSIEHLHGHEVDPAFREFARVLRRDGFALIRCPDLEAVARALLQRGPDAISYISPAGPITPIDMLYGHGTSVAKGNAFMRHHTGFTAERLARLLMEAGFKEVYTRAAAEFDLWALALMPEAYPETLLPMLAASGLDFDT